METFLFKVEKVLGEKLIQTQVYLILSDNILNARHSLEKDSHYISFTRTYGEENTVIERISAREAQEILGYDGMFLGQKYLWRK